MHGTSSSRSCCRHLIARCGAAASPAHYTVTSLWCGTIHSHGSHCRRGAASPLCCCQETVSTFAQGTTQGSLMWPSRPQTAQYLPAHQMTSRAESGARMALRPPRCDEHARSTCCTACVSQLFRHTWQCRKLSAPALLAGMERMLKLGVLRAGCFLPWAPGLRPACELGTLWHPAGIRSAAWSSPPSMPCPQQSPGMQCIPLDARHSSGLVRSGSN